VLLWQRWSAEAFVAAGISSVFKLGPIQLARVPAHMFLDLQSCAVDCTAGMMYPSKSRPKQDAAAATEPPDTAPMGVVPGVITPTFWSAQITPKYLLHDKKGCSLFGGLQLRWWFLLLDVVVQAWFITNKPLAVSMLFVRWSADRGRP
jgi:hypothetical protein